MKKKELVYPLQCSFRQKHLTAHVLIHLTDKIENEINKGNYAYGIFVDFQKKFDRVDHHMLLKKCYSVRGIMNKWFASYLSNRICFNKSL